MTTNQQISPSESFESNPTNGRGYMFYSPQGIEPTAQRVEQLESDMLFPYAPYFFDVASDNPGSNVLIQGGPGAGKSHLAQDLLRSAVAFGRPMAVLKLHITCGKRFALEQTADQVEQFVAENVQDAPIVLLDNVDYFGYGRSRNLAVSQDSIQYIGGVAKACMDDPKISVIGLAHTPLWRDTHWSKSRPEITEPAQEILDAMGEPTEFEGELDCASAWRYYRRTGMDAARALVLVKHLEVINETQVFRQVQHLPRFLNRVSRPTVGSVKSAIERINQETRIRELALSS